MSTAQKKAVGLISKYKSRDPRFIAKQLGIQIIEKPLPARMSGFLCTESSYSFIIINRNLNEGKKRYAIAHELGHYCLDPNYELCMHLSDNIRATKSEKRADLFAAYLLIESFAGETWEIAEKYDVTEELIAKVRDELC